MAFIKIFRCCKFSGSLFSFNINRSFHNKSVPERILYKMKTAYIYNTEGEETVYITVNFSEMNIDNTFNFQRNIMEPLENFLKRFNHKLEACCNKKILKKRKKGIIPVENEIDFTSSLLINNQEISGDLIFQDLFQKDFNGDLKLRILDSDYDVVINSPLVKELQLSKFLHVGCLVSPVDFEMKFADLEKSDFIWYKSATPSKKTSWQQCGKGFYYKIKVEDLGHYLKLSCTPKMDDKIGPTIEVVTSTTVTNSDMLDEILLRHKYTTERTNSDEFRIVSYNILADMYMNTKEAKTQIFTFCNPDYLDFDYRKNLLDFEIIGYNADILCLQEFDRKLYNCNLFLFNSLGYECVYFEKEASREGCGFLYDRKKFQFLEANQYIFTKELFNNPMFSDIKSKIQENSELTMRLNNISSQIQLVALECVGNNILVIGNVHFYFHPDADHIRLLQGILALRILLKSADTMKEMNKNKKVSILLCGDFNSTPECGFHKLLQEGSVDSDHIDWKSKESEVIKDLSFSHSLSLKSSYDNTKFTNYIATFQGCLDYIYYQTDHLQLKQTVPIPSEEVLSREKGIPSKYFPSDHVALIADFKFNNEN